MAKAIYRLNVPFVESADKLPPKRYADGGGLYLSTRGGGRRWVFLYRWRGDLRELGLGSARPGSLRRVSLKRAREIAATYRDMLAQGISPQEQLAADRQVQAPEQSSHSFADCADELIKNKAPSWKNAKHAAQWQMTLTHYAAPLRALSVDKITTEDVLGVLQSVWSTKPETASRVRGRIERVLDFAKAQGFRSGENPARWRGHLDQILPARAKLTRGHHAALPYADVAGFMANLGKREAIAARALEFAILTAARSGEVLGARWTEIDMERRIWTVPAVRMKPGREHRVPLSEAAMNVLTVLKDSGCGNFVFPGQRGDAPLSTMSLEMCLRRTKIPVTVHGFRSTFRDWAAETTDFQHETCEMALAHTISNKAEAAYRRGDLFDKRRELMQAWADYCGTATGA